MLDHKNPEENNIKDFGFLYLRNLDKIFKAATLEEKHRIVGLTYPEKMTFQNGAFQTVNGSDIISLLCRSGKTSSQEKGKPQKNFCGISQEVTPIGFFSNPEFIIGLKEMYKLRISLDEDGVTTIPTKKLN